LGKLVFWVEAPPFRVVTVTDLVRGALALACGPVLKSIFVLIRVIRVNPRLLFLETRNYSWTTPSPWVLVEGVILSEANVESESKDPFLQETRLGKLVFWVEAPPFRVVTVQT
jgi:hypothetical protein